MIATSPKDWKKEFGLTDRKPPYFFSSIDQINEDVRTPHAHTLRRAFEQLGVEGVLCQEQSPVIYFRQINKIDTKNIVTLHRSFWNQGVAPILVLIAPEEVHVYSGLIPPEASNAEAKPIPGLVEILNRVQDLLQSFLLSVESGEYFHIHSRSFDPNTRVDRNLLRNLKSTRQKLDQVLAPRIEPQTLDALLCRLVFTCYLFDRHIIDQSYLKKLHIDDAEHMRDIPSKQPRSTAKANLYTLFEQLGNDFNGDLFNANLREECLHIDDKHIDIIDLFFHGTGIQTGQQSFWPYDFSFIPIETISAIYENFLKVAGEEQKKEAGAFYTPRFLAEFVLDIALDGETSLLDKVFLDPACGSGIFLVGLFNRLAQEWKLKNPGARYDRRAKGLMDILCKNLYGVDSNRSACQITAFSLYLAFLDQLSPPDIHKLLGKWDRLPNLVSIPGEMRADSYGGTIRNADFFTDAAEITQKVHIIIGNPPWGPVKKSVPPTKAENWCAEQQLEIPNREKSVPFIWKAPRHLATSGKVCFVLPHGILFNHNDTAVNFQQSLFRTHTVDRIVNLTDYQFFLFEESQAPALVIRLNQQKPMDGDQIINYWVPKTDWAIRQAEIVNVLPQDRIRITVREVLTDLKGEDAPQIWKEKFWATPHDWRLLERLSLHHRLRTFVGSPSDKVKKRWIIGQGFEQRDEATSETKKMFLPTERIIEARDTRLQLFLLPSDCASVPSREIIVRKRSNTNIDVYIGPLVLITKGFNRSAFADFDVVFRHALRGIHGPKADRDLLIFLAAYLRSDLARFYLFHTSSNWGVSRAEVHVEELLRLPFPLPYETNNPKRNHAIVQEIASMVTNASNEASEIFADREEIVSNTQKSINKLILEYFDIDATELMLVNDTINIIIPSIRPTRVKTDIPTIRQCDSDLRNSYAKLLCDRLNNWAKEEYKVHYRVISNSNMGLGIIILEKTRSEENPTQLSANDSELLDTFNTLQRITSKKIGTMELVRGLKIFHKNLLYITKPLGQRFWINTAALNDADEIATTILTRSAQELV